MQIMYINQNAQLIPAGNGLTHHQKNLQFLSSNQAMRQNIQNLVRVDIQVFVNKAISGIKAYINSGKVATDVCQKLKFPQNSFYHSLVGSALNDELSLFPSPVVVIANKSQGNTWFDYFSK